MSAPSGRTLNLTLVTPEKKLLADVEIEELFVPAFRGQLDILPGHAPLMTTIETGLVKYRLKGSADLKTVVVSWGYCQVTPKGVTILAETAERAEEIDQDRALAAWKLSLERLDSGELDPERVEKYRRKLRRAEVRRIVVGQSGQSSSTH